MDLGSHTRSDPVERHASVDIGPLLTPGADLTAAKVAKVIPDLFDQITDSNITSAGY